MVTILFHETVFGPIRSRRLGTSLGINLSPTDGKICSYDCIYCEAGYNAQGQGSDGIPSRETVKKQLKKKLEKYNELGLDVITFSGNGEPTVHPQFKEIISDTIMLRDKICPNVKINVLTNGSFLTNPKVIEALKKVDGNIIKFDSAISPTMRLINAPVSNRITIEGLKEDIKQFGGNCTIQTMLLRGEHDGKRVDNTTDEEIEALIEAYKDINPKGGVMLYSIDRKTPEEKLEKVPKEELESIAERMRKESIKVETF